MSFNISEMVRGGTMCLSKAGLAQSSSGDATYKTAAPNGAGIDFAIEGILYHLTDASCTAVAMTAASAQAAQTTCLYLITVNASNTLATVKGTAVANASLTNGTNVLRWPQPASGYCPIGAVKVVTASVATFTAATTSLNATDVTSTFYDLFCIPPSPRTS